MKHKSNLFDIQTNLPLSGLLLVDFSQGVAGPSCTMLLGDLGAKVIKVEPITGDWARSVGDSQQPYESSTHLSLNRNKQSIKLDLTKADGKAIAHKLSLKADIIVQNFREGVMRKYALDYNSLVQHNPQLIYGSILGYGDSGPLRNAPATDSTMQAFGGLMSINGDQGTLPLRMGNMVSDMLAGSYLAQGILAALLAMNKSGQGQQVKVSLLDALIAFQAAPIMNYTLTGNLPTRSGRNHPLIAPSGTYKVKNGYVALVVLQSQWVRFCTAFQLKELANDAKFTNNSKRLKNQTMLRKIIDNALADKTLEEMLELANKWDLVCAPINDYQMLLNHEQVHANKVIEKISHPKLGKLLNVKNPIKYSELTLNWSAPPMLGEHTGEILQNILGYTPEQISKLIEANVIGD